jgi:hypothetical protein
MVASFRRLLGIACTAAVLGAAFVTACGNGSGGGAGPAGTDASTSIPGPDGGDAGAAPDAAPADTGSGAEAAESEDAGPPCNVVDVNGNGPDDDDVQALLCAGSDAVLCAGTVYAVNGLDDGGTCGAGLHFVTQGQKLYTTGHPTGTGRAVLRLQDPSTATVLVGNGVDDVSLAYVEIDGSRPALNWLNGGDALVSLTGQNVEVGFSYIHDPRGWSTLHIIEGANLSCSGAQVHDNTLGPAGCDKQGNGCTAADPLYASTGTGSWADGLSLSCKNAVVHDNTINDATDGAIVMFGAPGSHVYDNHVYALSRHLFGGINMVDPAPYSYDAGAYSGGDYTGDEVDDNDIHATGARIDVGIAQGPFVWSSWCGQSLYNRGGDVHDNTVDGPKFGYGFVADGVLGWTEQNNTSTATHSLAGDGCGADLPPDAGPYFYHDAHVVQSNVQGQDVPTGVHNVLQ